MNAQPAEPAGGARDEAAASRQAAILDALPAHIAVLDAQGRIVSVSQAWRRFDGAAEVQDPGHAIGVNYLDLCGLAQGAGAPAAHQVADGIRAVLAGGIDSFALEYRSRSPSGERWFMLTVTPLAEGPDGAVIMHVDVSERRRAEERLVETSRLAGMAEVATNILHNVGNVLNSVNVSATLVADSIKGARASRLSEVSALLREHEADLGAYLSSDPRGRHIPVFLEEVARDWLAQQKAVIDELGSLRANIDHIREIVAMQQGYARAPGAAELIDVAELVEHSLRMSEAALVRHQVRLVRAFEPVPAIRVEKHKVLQILVNLLRNAKHACDESGRTDKELTVGMRNGAGHVRIWVSDNGVGIAAENLARMFVHGYTTRKDGHGFGLHSGALAARDMGGSLGVHSDGPGKGATFTLELPLQPPGIGA
ncbi:MAG TPA: ATP-binding protein [Solimonas sp.]|nr:ATP-binding protein [Solimonas sp.]